MTDKILYYKLTNCGRSRSQIIAKIAQIDAIIESLINTALVSVGNGNMIQYEIDTGQTKQKVQYTTPSQVTAAIENYEKIRQMYNNKLTPRTFKLTNYKNFRK